MSGITEAGKFLIDQVKPDAETERFIFRRFLGSKLRQAAETGSELKDSDIESVTLRINPQEVSYAERKMVQKVPTAAPGRFVIFDWGSELTLMTIQGCTGNLLPESILNNVGGKVDSVFSSISEQISSGGSDLFNAAVSPISYAMSPNAIMNTLTYDELINMSPKYKTFSRLKSMYHLFDADSDILTLEMGETVYRGFFEEFNFTIAADSPWNWKYTIVFVIMEDFSESIKRGDSSYDTTNTNIVFTG